MLQTSESHLTLKQLLIFDGVKKSNLLWRANVLNEVPTSFVAILGWRKS